MSIDISSSIDNININIDISSSIDNINTNIDISSSIDNININIDISSSIEHQHQDQQRHQQQQHQHQHQHRFRSHFGSSKVRGGPAWFLAMAPKGAKKVVAAKPPPVKAEPVGKALCIAGLTGKPLAAKVEYTLRTAPAHIKTAFAKRFKNLKSSNSAEKQEFIQKLFEEKPTGWQSPYFTSFMEVTHGSRVQTSTKWFSWKTLLTREDEPIAELMVKQGRVLHRPHALLDHDAVETAELDWHLRHQFAYKEDVTEENEDMRETIQSVAEDDGANVPEEKDEEEVAKDAKKALKQKIAKVRASWNTLEPQFISRLGQYETNEYPGTALCMIW